MNPCSEDAASPTEKRLGQENVILGGSDLRSEGCASARPESEDAASPLEKRLGQENVILGGNDLRSEGCASARPQSEDAASPLEKRLGQENVIPSGSDLRSEGCASARPQSEDAASPTEKRLGQENVILGGSDLRSVGCASARPESEDAASLLEKRLGQENVILGGSDLRSLGCASARPQSEEMAPCNTAPRRSDPSLRTPDKPNADIGRKHPIHLAPLEAHNRSIIVFVTAVTKRRRPILACPASHQAIVDAWNEASKWLVGRYTIMPDHTHFFCAPGVNEPPSLEKWMQFWKSRATSNMRRPNNSVWERHHWDRQLRSGESYDDKWEYVRNNPVRHGYVTKAEEWPYQGELNELRW